MRVKPAVGSDPHVARLLRSASSSLMPGSAVSDSRSAVRHRPSRALVRSLPAAFRLIFNQFVRHCWQWPAHVRGPCRRKSWWSPSCERRAAARRGVCRDRDPRALAQPAQDRGRGAGASVRNRSAEAGFQRAALGARVAALHAGRRHSPPVRLARRRRRRAAGGAHAQPGSQPTAQVPAGAEGGGGPSGALPVYGNASAGSKVFNPDMAVIGNFVGAAGKNTVAPLPALALPETELSLQAIVDPYARADFFLSFGEEGVAVEEGFLTFPALAGGLLMKVGRQYAGIRQGEHAPLAHPAVGRSSAGHDEPARRRRAAGRRRHLGGAADSEPVAVPRSDRTGVSRRAATTCSRASERSDLSYVGARPRLPRPERVDQHRPRRRRTPMDTTARGVVDGADLGRFTTSLFGVDATLRWRPLQRSIYHSFLGRGEVIWSRREQPDGRQDAIGLLRLGRLPVRPPLVRRPSLRPFGARSRCERSTTRVSRSSSPTGRASSARSADSTAARLCRRARPRTSSCSSSSSRLARTARIRSEVRASTQSRSRRHEAMLLQTWFCMHTCRKDMIEAAVLRRDARRLRASRTRRAS